MGNDPPASQQAACPFCHAAVPREIVVFGGACPACLIEIPGEEAPTDPGEALKAKIAAAEKKPLWPRLVLAALVLFVGFLVSVAAVSWAFLREPPTEVQALDWKPSMEHEDQEIPASLLGEEPVEDGLADAGTDEGLGARPVQRRVGGAPEAPATAGTVEVRMGPSLDDFAVQAGPGQRGPQAMVLEDPTQIEAMIDAVFHRYEHTLQACVADRRKARPGLSGTWEVGFVVGTDRVATDAWATGMSGRDGTLERCFVKAVRGWQFGLVKKPYTYTYPYTVGG